MILLWVPKLMKTQELTINNNNMFPILKKKTASGKPEDGLHMF